MDLLSRQRGFSLIGAVIAFAIIASAAAMFANTTKSFLMADAIVSERVTYAFYEDEVRERVGFNLLGEIAQNDIKCSEIIDGIKFHLSENNPRYEEHPSGIQLSYSSQSASGGDCPTPSDSDKIHFCADVTKDGSDKVEARVDFRIDLVNLIDNTILDCEGFQDAAQGQDFTTTFPGARIYYTIIWDSKARSKPHNVTGSMIANVLSGVP